MKRREQIEAQARRILKYILSLGCSLVLQNSYVSAASITLTVPSSELSVSVDPSKDNGFAKSSDAIVKVSTNGSWGYELNVKAKTDNTLRNGSSKFDSIASEISEDTFKSGATHNNKWGFKPSKLDGSSNTNFVAAPSTSNTLIEKTSSANSSSANSYTFAIGAKTDGSLPTGKYNNTFTFSAIANSVAYSITYELNDGAWTESGKTQSGSTTDSSVKLLSATPTRGDYEFLGWCTAPTSDDSCSGDSYNPGADYQLKNDSNVLTLYARWKDPRNLGDLGSMQSFDCSKITEIEEYSTLTDNRDGTKYKVAKLKDGRCWMMENLRIAGVTIDSDDSDITSGTFEIPPSGENIGGKILDFVASNSDVEHKAVYVNAIYGGYYTWFVATAGSGDKSVTSDGADVSDSICPKGWQLPRGNQDKYNSGSEFDVLVMTYDGNNATGSEALRKKPVPGFDYAGNIYYAGGSLVYRGSSGYYWSATAVDSTRAYRLYLDDSYADPGSRSDRVYGLSVRCLTRE